MEKLVVSTFIESGSFALYMDGEVIVLNSDSTTVELENNAMYVVQWFVKAPPGAVYSITISSPRAAQFQLTKLVAAGGKDYGGFYFNT